MATPVSVLICCANAGLTLPAALASTCGLDEVVVIDSGSTDDTEHVARSHEAAYHLIPWKGYTGQKLHGQTLCRNDWVFILDGDEELDAALLHELKNFHDDGTRDLYLIRRRTWISGRVARAWQPDRLDRLYHKGRCTYRDEPLHDGRDPSHPSRVGRLEGRIVHRRHVPPSFDDYFDGRLEQGRALLVARQLHARGRRATFADLALRPVVAFLKLYLLKGGFRDGSHGLLVAKKTAQGVFLKYAALWHLQNGLDASGPPS